MVAEWTSFSNPNPELPAAQPVAPAAVVSLEAAARGSTFAAIACALLDANVFVDVERSSRAQRELVRQLVPIAQLTVGALRGLKRLRPWPALAQRFADCAEQELLHAQLRAAVLPAGVGSPLPTRLAPTTTQHTTALVIVNRDCDRCARAMTPHNLRAVLTTLAGFNRRAPSRAARVGEVLLYGRLDANELAAPQSEFGDELRLTWLPGQEFEEDSPTPRAVAGEAPSLATLVALQRRYRDNLVAIGFGSATLDATALIGIPSFYFDETTAHHWLDCYRDGRYLVDARCDAAVYQWRLGLTREINTFIRINLRSGPGQRDSDERVWLDEAALADLMTALCVWMQRSLPRGQRNWSQRVRLSRSGLTAVPFARVRAQCCSEARQVVARLATPARACLRARRGSAGDL